MGATCCKHLVGLLLTQNFRACEGVRTGPLRRLSLVLLRLLCFQEVSSLWISSAAMTKVSETAQNVLQRFLLAPDKVLISKNRRSHGKVQAHTNLRLTRTAPRETKCHCSALSL
jgi:hypothetical protein